MTLLLWLGIYWVTGFVVATVVAACDESLEDTDILFVCCAWPLALVILAADATADFAGWVASWLRRR